MGLRPVRRGLPADAAVATTVLLILTHVVAVSIVIPAVARRLS